MLQHKIVRPVLAKRRLKLSVNRHLPHLGKIHGPNTENALFNAGRYRLLSSVK